MHNIITEHCAKYFNANYLFSGKMKIELSSAYILYIIIFEQKARKSKAFPSSFHILYYSFQYLIN